MMRSSILMAVLALFCAAACSPTKRNLIQPFPTAYWHIDTIMPRLTHAGNWSQILMKGTVHIQFDGQTHSADAVLACKKDSLICLAARTLGAEVLRIWANQDSMVCLNRLDKIYSTIHFQSIQRVFNIPFDFYTLQDLLLKGYAVYPHLNYELSIDTFYARLSGISGDFRCHFLFSNHDLKPLTFDLNSEKLYMHTKVARYEEFQSAYVAKSLQAQSKWNDKIVASWHIQWTSLESKPSSLYSLNIPSHYQYKNWLKNEP